MRSLSRALILSVALVVAAVSAEPNPSAYNTALGEDLLKATESFLSGASHGELMARVHSKGMEQSRSHRLMRPLSFYVLPFLEWALQHNVAFDSLDDTIHGLENFAHADDRIASHNSEEAGYTLGHNAYSHMSWEEFKTHFSIGGRGAFMGAPAYARQEASPRTKSQQRMLRADAAPEEVDWVSKGAVTNVKNQGSCGSCWSFSTTGAMEGALYLKSGQLIELSEQELVDCDTYDMGCNGGLMDYSFHWIQQNGGICSEQDYPYTARGGLCNKSQCQTVPGTDVARWVDVGHTEAELMAAVAQQPVSIAIEADQMSFQLYSGGVLTATCGTQLDHGVLLVGYGTSDDGVKYWKVKNSWGADWGADGYILLERGAFQPGGECGVLMQPSYPVLV